ncbi:MAG: hypothetical protein N2C14_33295, partial [Planctomycetales bacterium]
MPDPKNPQPTWSLPFEGAWPTSVAFLNNGRRVAAGNRDGQIFLWDLPENLPDQSDAKSDKKDNDQSEGSQVPPVRRLDGHSNGVTHLLALADGKTLISSSLDGAVRVWDTTAPATGKEEVVMDSKTRERESKRNKDALNQSGVEVDIQSASETLKGHGDWIQSLGISGDERLMISGDDSNLTIVREVASGKEVSRWKGYPGDWVTSAALSPDGKTAFTAEYSASHGSFDRPPAQARFWNVADGSEKLDVLKVQFPDVKARDNSYGYARTWGKFMARGLVASAFSPDGK